MAIYKPGPLGVQEMGKVGGVIFSISAAGPTVKIWRMPVNKRRTVQLQRRRALATQSSRWFESLSSAQRTAWESYAPSVDFLNSLGQTYTINGHQMFVRTQLIHAQAAASEDDGAPTAPGLPTARSYTLTFNHTAGTLALDTVAPAGLAADKIYAMVYQYDKVTRNRIRGKRVTATIMVANIGLPTTIYTFGTAPPGSATDYAAWTVFYYLDSDNRFTKPVVVKTISS